MSIATIVPAHIEISRRKLAGVLAATTAAAAAVTWAVATVAIDTAGEPTHTTTTPIQYAIPGSPLVAPIAAPAVQVVADSHHGDGITVCPDGNQPIIIADSYHGVSATFCP